MGHAAQRQAPLPIDPVDPLVVGRPPVPVAQRQEAPAEAPAPVRRGQPHQPVRKHRGRWHVLGLILVAGLGNANHPTRPPLQSGFRVDHFDGHLFTRSWPQDLPQGASLRISASICDSASLFCSRRFSASHSCHPVMSEAVIPPDLLCQLSNVVCSSRVANTTRGPTCQTRRL